MKQQFTPLQELVRQSYADGDMNHVEKPSELKSCGDTLFAFCMYEANEAENAGEYDHMLHNAIKELEDLRAKVAAKVAIEYTDTLPISDALWWFIENMGDAESPGRTEVFFHLRDRERQET
jgi:hypothetical protein